MTDTAYGYGTIYQRSSDRRWVAAVSLPSVDGKRRRKTFTATSRSEVAAQLAAYRRENPPPDYIGRSAFLERAQALGTHTEKEWHALVRSTKGICHYCGITTKVTPHRYDPMALQMDHLIPLSRGGSDAIDNIVVSCRACNQEKGRMTANEYAAWKASQ